MKPQAIFIEAGHGKGLLGMVDLGASGNLGAGRVYERDFAVRIATVVLSILQKKEELNGILLQGVGIQTSANIRKKMLYVNTVMKENHLQPLKCLGVAIHMNSSTDKKAHGFEVWYQKSGKSLMFANYVADSWAQYKITSLRPKPVNNSAVGRYGRFYIDDTQAQYIIVETGFISNEEEAGIINNCIDKVAECIAHGILEYVRKS